MKLWVCQNLFCLILVVLFNQLVFGQIHSALGAKVISINAENAINLERQAETSLFEWNRQSLEFSHKTYLEAVAIWNKLGDLKKSSVSLRKAAKTAKILGRNNVAENLYLQSLEISKKSKIIDEQINSLCELSLLYLEEGNLSKAESIFLKANKLTKFNGSKFDNGLFWFTSAEFEYAKRNIKKSIEFYIKSVESVSASDNLSYKASYLRFLGDAYLFEENYNQAISSLQESLAISRMIGDKRGQALSHVTLAHTSSRLNDKQTALNYYYQAENLFPNDIDFVEKARLMNAIGNIFKDFGELQLSIDYRMKALQLFDKANYAYGKVATLSSLGMLYTNVGDFEKAKSFLFQSEFWAKKLNDDYYLAITWEELGNLTFYEGNYDSANNYYNKSLKYFLNNNSKREIAFIYEKLGQIAKLQNKNNNSKMFFQLSLELNRKIQNKFGESENLFNLAKIDLIENKTTEALNKNKESINLTENLYSEVANANLKRKYFSKVFDRYELYINLLMKLHRQYPGQGFDLQALQATEKSRARSMLEKLSLSEANFNKDANPETVKREKEIRNLLNTKADKFTDALSVNTDKLEIQKLSNEIGGLENELEQIKADLKQNSPIYSAIKNPPPFDVTDFQNRVLDDRTLLLEFSLGRNESFLWLVGKGFIESYILPPRVQIESRIEKLRKLIDSRQMLEGETTENYQARITDAETEFEREAQVFSNELLGQISDKIREKRLVIVPDGKLHYFPIVAMPFPNSTENEPILLTNETIYQPSAATLTLLTQIDKTIAAPKNLLVFSDPIFSTQDARISAVAQNENQTETSSVKTDKFRFAESLTALSRLNASQDEAELIIKIIGASDSTVFTGAAATRENAMDSATADYKIVHFATHGLINEERPELSGIVLSQVDETGNNLNGVVRLQDIYAMNLSADLVVLSACSTGIGKEVKGEGLMSLNNAFLQTGAKTVISSLWKVDDYATRELMKNFYQELTSGTVTTSEALRRAQIKMRQNQQYQSPFYWAAFTVQGDFQTAPKLSGGFGFWIYTFFLVPFLLAGIYAYRRRFKLSNRKIVSKN